jgi:hypothetical protein
MFAMASLLRSGEEGVLEKRRSSHQELMGFEGYGGKGCARGAGRSSVRAGAFNPAATRYANSGAGVNELSNFH